MKEDFIRKYSKRVKSRKIKKGGRGYSPWYKLIGGLQRKQLAKDPIELWNQRGSVDHSGNDKCMKVKVHHKRGGAW